VSCKHWLTGSESAHQALTSILEASANARFDDAPSTDSAWQLIQQQEYQARLQLIELALQPVELKQGVRSMVDTETDKTLALACAWIDVLNTLPKRILNQGSLQAHIRVAGQSHNPASSEDHFAVQAMLHAAVTAALESVEEAIASPTYQRWYNTTQLRALPVWLLMRRAQLQLWQKQRPNLLRQTITLTPVRKWYIAFRHR